MADIKFILWTHQENKKDDSYSIRLRVTRDRKVKYFSTNLHAKPSQWSDDAHRFIESKRLCSDYIVNNVTLTKLEAKANAIINQFEAEDLDWTLADFEKAFRDGKVKSARLSIGDYIDQLVENLEDTGHFGNAQVYKNVKVGLTNMYPDFPNLSFSRINISFVQQLDHDLEKRGVSGNGRSFYHRTLRAILNKAIKSKLTKITSYPYGKYGFSVSSMEQPPEKRHLDVKQLEIFKTIPGKTLMTETARRIFLFCYYGNGMPFVDAGHLKNENLKDATISVPQHTKSGKIKVVDRTIQVINYRRQKTKNSRASNIEFKVIAPIQEQLKWFKNNTRLIDDFLLPIVSVPGYQGRQLYDHILCGYKRVQRGLKAYCEEVGIPRISTYWSRHTFAMRMMEGDCGVLEIQQALGHRKVSTTQNYLDEFDQEVLSNKIEKLL